MGCASSKEGQAMEGSERGEEEPPLQTSAVKLDLAPAAASKDSTVKRRVGVSAEAYQAESGAFQKVVHAKSDDIAQQITEATAHSSLFQSLDTSQRAEVVAAMREVKYQPGQIVIQQGDVGDDFYVVLSGTYNVFLKQKGDAPIHTYHKGGTFGELSLMYNSPRAATVRCETAGVLFALDRRTFRAILMERNMAVLNSSTQAGTSTTCFWQTLTSPLASSPPIDLLSPPPTPLAPPVLCPAVPASPIYREFSLLSP